MFKQKICSKDLVLPPSHLNLIEEIHCEKCANTEFFLVRIHSKYGKNTDQVKLLIRTLFSHCNSLKSLKSLRFPKNLFTRSFLETG